MRFSILKRIGIECFPASGVTLERVTAGLRSITLKLSRLLKVSFQYDKATLAEGLDSDIKTAEHVTSIGIQTPWQHRKQAKT